MYFKHWEKINSLNEKLQISESEKAKLEFKAKDVSELHSMFNIISILIKTFSFIEFSIFLWRYIINN